MIKDFIAQVKSSGMARTNRYAVEIGIPFKFDTYTLQTALLFCDQVQIPGLNYNTNENRSFGEVRKAPYEKLFEDINMSFYVDKDMQVKKLFDVWQNSIMDPNTRTFNYYDSYVSDIKVYVQDINDNKTYTVTMHEAFPKSVGAIQLDYAGKDVMKLSVNFAYKWYETSTTIQGVNHPVDPINSFTSRLSNFAIGAAGAALVSKLPNLIKF
jgi:hypothetical protein